MRSMVRIVIGAGFQQVRRKGMTKRVAVGGFVDARFKHGLVNGALDHLFVEVMALDTPRTWIGGMRGGREDVLPAPVAVFVRVFHFERVGQIDGAVAGSEVVFV